MHADAAIQTRSLQPSQTAIETEPTGGNAMTRTKPSHHKAENSRDASKPSRRRRRIIRVTIAVLALVLLYTLGGFLGVPWLVKGPILSRINDRLNATATIANVSCNPFTFRLILREIRVVDAAGTDVATVGEVDVNASLWRTIFRPGYQAQWALVRDVWAKGHISEDGHVSVEDLFKPAPAPKPGEEPDPLTRWPRLVVEQCRVERINIEVSHAIDANATYAATLTDVSLTADGLDLGPNITSTISIAGKTARDEAFDIQMLLTPDPLTLRLDVTAVGLLLEPLSPYGIEYAGLNVRLMQGTADAELIIDFKPAESAPHAMAEVKRLTARDVRLQYVDGPYAGMMSTDVPRLDIEDAELDVVARRLSVERIALTGASAFVRRNEAGQLDVETVLRVTKEAGDEIVALAAGELIPQRAPDQAPPPPFVIPADAPPHAYPIERITLGIMTIAEAARGPWDVRATNVSVDGATLAWQDSGAPGEVAVAVSNARVDAGPIHSSKRFEIPLVASVTLGGGTARIEGLIRPLDLELDAKILAENVDAVVAAGYVPTTLGMGLDGVTIRKALASADGTLRGKMVLADTGEPTLEGTWEGRAGLTEVALANANANTNAQALGASTLLTTGTLRLSGPISAMQLAWDGSASGETIALDAAIAGEEAGPVRVAIERGDITGAATATIREGGIGLVTKLNAEASGISAQAPGIRDLQATVARASVGDIELDLTQMKARVESVLLESPSASTRVPVLPPKKEKNTAPPDPREYIGIPEPAFTIEIGRVALQGASARIEDPNTTPPMVMTVDRVDATLQGVATREGAPILIQLAGMVQESGRMSINGTVDLFRAMPSGELQIEVASMPLKAFDAATGRYLGYEVDRGRATVDMPLVLKDGELSGNVKINLDRFYLGDEVDSDEALNVPVQLGLSLLRDSNEQIDATVGVKGRIDEPGFTVAGLVWQAISNLIVKAATAPFEILGSLFGSEEDLSRVAFDPGTDRLGAASLGRLDTLARAMRNRPGLTLSVAAQSSPKADLPVLKREALRAWVLDAVRKRDPRVTTLTDDLYRAQLNDAFIVQASSIPLPDREAVPFEEREAFMLDRIDITQAKLIELANTRARRVVDVLVVDGSVPADRVTLVPADEQTQTADEPESRLEIGK
jgi:hypothetical protein